MTTATAVAAAFREMTGRSPETVWSAPGRANLIGEHTDYNDGLVLPFAIQLRTFAAVGRRDDGRVVIRSLQAPGDDGAATVRDLRPRHPANGWVRYPYGVLWALGREGAVGGFDIVVDSEVPAGAGMSSSAALECSVACAIDELAGLGLSRSDLAQACRRAEDEFAGVPCGPMDQFAALLCTHGAALLLDTRDLSYRQVALDPGATGHVLLLADTGVQHELAAGAYAGRQASCKEAARVLGVTALRDARLSDVESAFTEASRLELGRRARHIVTENARVLEVVRLLEHGQLGDIGPLLSASHASLRDDFEVSCPELDLAVEAAASAGASGARMIGGGFGGSVLVLTPAVLERDVHNVIEASFAANGLTVPTIRSVLPSGAAERHF